MFIRKARTRWRVFLDPESELERQMVDGAIQKTPHAEHPIFRWLDNNVVGWSYSTKVINLKGDPNDYTVLSFHRDEDAILFRMTFEGREKKKDVEPWVPIYSPAEIADPKAATFAKTNRIWHRKAKSSRGREVRFCWGTERNAAGFFLGWREVEGAEPDKFFSRRKKKDVLAWVARNAAK